MPLEVVFDSEIEQVYFIEFVGTRLVTGTDDCQRWIVLSVEYYEKMKRENEVDMLVLLARMLHRTRVTIAK